MLKLALTRRISCDILQIEYIRAIRLELFPTVSTHNIPSRGVSYEVGVHTIYRFVKKDNLSTKTVIESVKYFRLNRVCQEVGVKQDSSSELTANQV